MIGKNTNDKIIKMPYANFVIWHLNLIHIGDYGLINSVNMA